MSVSFSYPGTYIDQLPSRILEITGIATSIPAFIGLASRGSTNDLTSINGSGEYGIPNSRLADTSQSSSPLSPPSSPPACPPSSPPITPPSSPPITPPSSPPITPPSSPPITPPSSPPITPPSSPPITPPSSPPITPPSSPPITPPSSPPIARLSALRAFFTIRQQLSYRFSGLLLR